MIEAIGWFAAFLYAVSGLPFCLQAIRTKRSDASISGCLMIIGGSVLMLIYELATAQSIPQIIDFVVVGLSWVPVLYYRLFPREVGLEEN